MKHPGIAYFYCANNPNNLPIRNFPIAWKCTDSFKGHAFWNHATKLFCRGVSETWDAEGLLEYMLTHLKHQDREFLL